MPEKAARTKRRNRSKSLTLQQHSFADDGWALWLDGDDTSTLYLNDWLDPRGRSYVDVAIHARSIRVTRSLNLYIPFPVSQDELVDISPLLRDEKVLYATFNAACIIDYRKNECTSELAYHGKTVDLVHIDALGYTLAPLSEGTLLTVDIPRLCEFLANDEAYFIFRLPHKSLDRIFAQQTDVRGLFSRLRDQLTSPVVAEKYGYSVRINEARLLPLEIARKGAFHRQKLKRAAISLSISEDYDVNDRDCYRIRRLEAPLYRDYVPEGFSCNNVITYQWDQTREKNLLGHFNFYFSIARNAMSRASLIFYLLVVVVLGSCGSAFWDLIKLIFGG